MKFKSLVAASALALSSLGAFAADFAFTTPTGGVAEFWQSPSLSQNSHFSQTLTFSNLAAGTYDIYGAISGTNLAFTSVSIGGHAWDLYGTQSNARVRFGEIVLPGYSNTLSLIVVGDTLDVANKPFGYAGQLNAVLVANPVPEPFSYAMLLAGMGLIGSIVRRRSKSESS